MQRGRHRETERRRIQVAAGLCSFKNPSAAYFPAVDLWNCLAGYNRASRCQWSLYWPLHWVVLLKVNESWQVSVNARRCVYESDRDAERAIWSIEAVFIHVASTMSLLWVTFSMWLHYRLPWRWYAYISLSYTLYTRKRLIYFIMT